MAKTCLDCPSFTQTKGAPNIFRRALGVPMCARFAHPLMIPKLADPEHTLRDLGESCPSYGQFRPDQPVNFAGLNVAFPDVEHAAVTEDGWQKGNCTSCAMCQHYVNEERVGRELGLTAGMCLARGRLIMTNRQRQEASNCDYRITGPNAPTTEGLTFFRQYDSGGFSTTVRNPIASTSAQLSVTPDPRQYATDKPVTPEDEKDGIGAWRKVADPAYAGRQVFLPIFRDDFFDEAERALIPRAGGDEHIEQYLDHDGLVYSIAVEWQELDEVPALWGPAGVGKTELARYMAYLMNLPFVRVPISGSTELDDIAGKIMYREGEGTYPMYGKVSKGWSKPCVLLIDEPNTGRPDVWQFLRPLFDNSKTLTVDFYDSVDIRRHDYCYPVLSMNPAWDPRNRGAEEIADADASRLTHIFMDLPNEELERKIIAARVASDGWDMTEEQLTFVMNVARDIRALIAEGTVASTTWGIRPQIQVARALRWFEPKTAYRRAVVDYLEPKTGKAILDCVEMHTTPDLSVPSPF